MKLTTVYVAMALSPCNKAIAMRSDGVHIIAERTAWKSGYDLIYISNDMQKFVARYVDRSKEDFFKLLRIDSILDDHCVWRPLTDSVVEELLGRTGKMMRSTGTWEGLDGLLDGLLDGIGNSPAVLDESMIENMFKPYR
jgi:hypothetical protein